MGEMEVDVCGAGVLSSMTNLDFLEVGALDKVGGAYAVGVAAASIFARGALWIGLCIGLGLSTTGDMMDLTGGSRITASPNEMCFLVMGVCSADVSMAGEAFVGLVLSICTGLGHSSNCTIDLDRSNGVLGGISFFSAVAETAGVVVMTGAAACLA